LVAERWRVREEVEEVEEGEKRDNHMKSVEK